MLIETIVEFHNKHAMGLFMEPDVKEKVYYYTVFRDYHFSLLHKQLGVVAGMDSG